MKVKIAINGKGINSISMQLNEIQFESFAKACSECKKGGKHESYFIRGGDMLLTEPDLKADNIEKIAGGYLRNNKSLKSASVLILDADGSIDNDKSAPPGIEINNALKKMGVMHFIYSTHSHQIGKKGNRYRVIIPCKMESKIQLELTLIKVIDEIRSAGCDLGSVFEAKTWSQPWFFPTRDDPDDNKFEYYDYLDGDSKEYEAVKIDSKLHDELNKRKKKRESGRIIGKRTISVEEQIQIITSAGEGLHPAMMLYSYQMIKDGVNKSAVINTIKGLCAGWNLNDSRLKERYDDIEKLVAGALSRAVDDRIESTENNTEKSAFGSFLLKSKGKNIKSAPEYPYGFMEDLPEPWPMIWREWKKLPAELVEPLLVPTILSFHGYLLNNKYITERGRKPNLYQLVLAQSAGMKDTNSLDVLRLLMEKMAENQNLSLVFDNIGRVERNLTSDTSFLNTLNTNDGRMYWINTEATRIFQLLSGSGNQLSAVMGLSDKIIEVADGYEISGKGKAEKSVKGESNPNIQLLFYAQPETIERHIGMGMVDSGLLGRALITLDIENERNSYNFFPDLSHFDKDISNKLVEFYGKFNLKSTILSEERYKCIIRGDNKRKATRFANEIYKPLMMDISRAKVKTETETKTINGLEELKESKESYNDTLFKIISRMGNATEQIYTIILGVCREWDISNEKPPRSEIDIESLYPILEFFAKAKFYVIDNYVDTDVDAVVSAVERVMVEIISGARKIDHRYDGLLNLGKIPKSQLVNILRNDKGLKNKLGEFDRKNMTYRCGQAINVMIDNELIFEEKLYYRGSKKSMLIVHFGYTE